MNLTLPFLNERTSALEEAVGLLASSESLEDRGAVFTQAEVVEALLDLCGYTVDECLEDKRLLEPSFGDGDFLLVAVQRLLESIKRRCPDLSDVYDKLEGSIRAVELHEETYSQTALRLRELLTEAGLPEMEAESLVGVWLVQDDFLLTPLDGAFDVVVGNPPYVRQERIPAELLSAYKKRYSTLYDRADLYVLFYERGLDLLAPAGLLGFICANRWLKNKYGGPLRKKVASDFNLKFFIDMEYANAFHAEVSAYPAITVIERSSPAETLLALGHRESADGMGTVAESLLKAEAGANEEGIVRLSGVTNENDPWLLDSPHILPVLRRLEHSYPTLEQAGTRVTIGVATGADRVYIDQYEAIPVEPARKLRLAMAADCSGGEVAWGGKGVMNPYEPDGALAVLSDYPEFSAYLHKHADVLKKRHVARRNPDKWYRTIDRIYPELVDQPKLLIPDIKGEATVAYDEGHYYPHHNLYVVTSEQWDLRALQAILRSSVALMFVAAYCVKMSGGFLRFQAQYLRRIRCPRLSDLSSEDIQTLVEVSTSTEQQEIDSVVFPLYGLGDDEVRHISEFADDARVPRKT